jgi:uncharacterized protein (UPF0248 family)
LSDRPDPVSWKVVEPGWKVLDESGEEIGRVNEITGDAEADIFDGVEIPHGLLSENEYVPSERVVDIREGEVIVKRA